MEKKEKKGCNLFDFFYGKDRIEDSLDDDIDESRGIKNYFRILGRNFNRIFTLNIYAVIGNFSIFFIILALSENLHKATVEPVSNLFGPLYGAIQLGAVSPATSALYGAYGVQTNVAIWTPWAWGFLIAGALILLVTFGPVTAGITYNMRNIVRREPIFMWEDFKHAFKSNFKQSLAVGIFDLVTLVLLVYNIYFYYLNLGRYVMNVMFWVSIIMLLFYTFMRNYIYLMIVTFELSIPKIYKNALIFSVLGFGRNFISFLTVAFIVIINYAIMLAYLPIGIVLPLIITIGLCTYTAVYTTWPKIYKVMIEPYI